MSNHLTTTQRQQFVDEGYLVMPQAVPQALVHRALHAINHSLGQGRDRGDVAGLNNLSWCPELGDHEVVTDLFNHSAAATAAADLLGTDQVVAPGAGQIPPRFPRALDAPTPKPLQGHIDGLGNGLNGMDEGEYRRFFSLLAVVLLSDLPEEHMGNFTVWPGSHHRMADYLAHNGHEVLAKGQPRINWDIDPRMITGKAGDVVFTHYLTLHSAAPNLSPFVRYAAIFRVQHRDAETNGTRGYAEPWLEYEGLHDLVGGDSAMAG